MELSFFFSNYSVFQRRYHIFGVLIEAARLVCTTENVIIADPRQWACGINTPGSFEMLSAVLVYFSLDILELLQPVEHKRSNTLAILKSYNSRIRVCLYKFKVEPTSRCLVRKTNDVGSYKMSFPWCRFILSLANFKMKVAVDVLYNRLY